MSEGLPLVEFWRSTPRVFTLSLEGRRQAAILRLEEALTQAYHTEAFARKRRLPKLEKILADVQRAANPPQAQSIEDMLETLRAIDGGRGLMNIKFVPNKEA